MKNVKKRKNNKFITYSVICEIINITIYLSLLLLVNVLLRKSELNISIRVIANIIVIPALYYIVERVVSIFTNKVIYKLVYRKHNTDNPNFLHKNGR